MKPIVKPFNTSPKNDDVIFWYYLFYCFHSDSFDKKYKNSNEW